jgi:ABC-type nitrate/sulfonate/bicarbonate transport system substrate-binding protein
MLLGWAISAGRDSNIKSVADLKNGKLGVSRIGSGSYVMGYVLADQEGWLDNYQRAKSLLTLKC